MRVLTILFCLTFLNVNIARAQDCPVIVIENETGLPGDTVTVDVYLSGVSDLLGFQGTFVYDTEILSFISAQPGETALDLRIDTNEPFFGSGQILITGLGRMGETFAFAQSAVLTELTFVIEGEMGSNSNITFDGSGIAIEFIISSSPPLDACNIINGSITVSDGPPPPNEFEVSVTTQNAICNQTTLGSISAMGFFGEPPYTFTWVGPNGFSATGQNIMNLLSGIYTLTATDTNGDEVVIDNILIDEEGGDFDISLEQQQNNFCDTGQQGLLRVETPINNTGAPLTYEWSNGETGTLLQNLSNGFYGLTVTDVVGCTQVHEYEINSSRAFMLDFEVGTPCEGDNTGFIYPVPLIGEFEFFWGTGAVTDSITNLAPGSYDVTIQEPAGCTQFRTVEVGNIVENSTLVIEPTCTSLGLDNGKFDPFYEGDLSGFAAGLLFDTVGNSVFPFDMAPGTYIYRTTSVNGCPYEETFTIEESLSDFTQDYYSCMLDSIQLSTATNNPDLLYSWSPDSSFVIDSIANPIFLDAEFANPTFTATLLTTGAQGCTRSFDFNIIRQDACVWPGDTNEDNQVSAVDLLHIGIANGSAGPTRPIPNTTDWAAQPATLWNENIGTTIFDKMFADTNGDGLINDADILVVEQNNGLVHMGLTTAQYENRQMGPPLFVDLLPNYIDGIVHPLEIVLGDNTDQAIGVYGVAFQLVYDPSVTSIDLNSFTEQGWLSGDQSATWDILFADAAAGILDIAITRTNGLHLDGFGPVAIFDATFFGSKQSEIQFEIRNPILLNANGVEMPTQPQTRTSIIGTNSSHTLASALYNESISPNPSSDYIVIQSDRNIDTYYISNTMGQRLQHGTLFQNQIDIKTLIPGMYTLQLKSAEGTTAHRLIVQ